MGKRTYLLVVQDVPGPNFLKGRPSLERALNTGDDVYVTDESIAFVRTAIPIETLTKRLNGSFASFFVTDITDSDRAGKMLPKFWDFLREDEQAAAE